MIVMENVVEISMDIDVEQDKEENRRRETSLHGKVPGRIPSAIHIGHRRDYGTATGGVVSGLINGSGIDCDPPSNNSDRSLEQLFLPLCSMSIAISSVVLPYWAWGGTVKEDVGLFKCCKAGGIDCSYDCNPSHLKFQSPSRKAAWLLITYIVLNGISILSVRDSDDIRCCSGIVVFLAAMIGYSGIIVFLSGGSFTMFPLRLSVHLAMLSLAVYLSYAAVCFKNSKVLICVPISTGVVYLLIFLMT